MDTFHLDKNMGGKDIGLERKGMLGLGRFSVS
jgi:hypothetical protein